MNQKVKSKKSKVGLSVLVLSVLVFGAQSVYAQPTQSPGVGSGAISADSLGNVGVGGAAATNIKLKAVASTSDSSTYAVQFLQNSGGVILVGRGDGRVGIGTSTPAYPLSVWGNIQAANGGSFIGNVAASNVTSAVFGSGNFAFPSALGVGYSSTVGLPQTLSVTGGGYFSGNVGIGTTTPATNLDVAGKIWTSSAGSGRNAAYDLAGNRIAAGSSIYSYGYICTGNASGACSGANGVVIGSANTAAIVNITNTGTTFFNGGNIGVGTTTPSYKIDVQGGQINSSGGLCIAGDCKTSWASVGGVTSFNTRTGAVTLTSTDVTDALTYTPLNIAGGTMTGSLTFSQVAANSTRNKGIVGTYSPSSLAAIWAMGAAYQLTADGSTGGTLYGLSYSYEPDYGGAGNNPGAVAGLNHQMQWRANGTTQTAIGTGIYTVGNFTQGTGKYVYPGSASGLTSGQTSYYLASHSSWGLYANTSLNAVGGLYDNGNRVYSASTYGAPNTGAVLSTIAYRDTAGDITTRLFRPTYTADTGTTGNYFLTINAAGEGVDNYSRPMSIAAVRTALGNYGSWITNTNPNYYVTAGNGNGVCFWADCTNYKIHMGSAAEYYYGPVTEYAIKFNMGAGTTGRGWVFGTTGVAPVVAFNVSGASAFAGTMTIGGGTGKINVGTVDPIYTIGGKKYATYLPAMTGQKEETTGTVELLQDENGIWTKEIDFKNQEEASDLWLFSKATDIEKQFDKMTILLTPGFNGKTWYERDPANLKLVIHGEYGGEVSYRLSAPRFDAGEWSNRADKEEAEGFNLDKLLNE